MNIIWFTKITDKDSFRNTQIMISEALRKQGNDVTLVLAKYIAEKKEPQKGKLYFPTIDVRLLSGVVYGLILALNLPSLLKEKKADIILVSGDTIWSPFLLFFRLYKVPVILDLRSLPIDTDNMFLKDISFFLSRYVTDGLTTITPELAEILKSRYHLQDKKIGIWSSGFSKDLFKVPKENTLKNRLVGKFVVLHHGTYSPARGIEELIRSIALIDRTLRTKIKLLLVGIPQNKFKDLTNLCKELQIEEQVEIFPKVNISEIPLYIEACDVGVIPLPTDTECWQVSVPTKTLEYLAMGKPIIATKIPFHKKIFERAPCGVLLETNSPKEIAKGILDLYQKKDQLHEMGDRGREFVETYYSWERNASELESFLKTIQVSA